MLLQPGWSNIVYDFIKNIDYVAQKEMKLLRYYYILRISTFRQNSVSSGNDFELHVVKMKIVSRDRAFRTFCEDHGILKRTCCVRIFLRVSIGYLEKLGKRPKLYGGRSDQLKLGSAPNC